VEVAVGEPEPPVEAMEEAQVIEDPPETGSSDSDESRLSSPAGPCCGPASG
jgi:hypothetical protein